MGQAAKPHMALLVEDDQDLLSLEVALIEETDLQVAEATSAEQALSFLTQHAGEVALLMADIRLSFSMDGVELARRVSQQWPWIRVIVTSGDPGNRLTDLPRTAVYMPKPWRALDILMEVERALGRGKQVCPSVPPHHRPAEPHLAAR